MMPKTRHGLAALEVLSAMQKHIRRSDEREAMLCACELIHTSKAYMTMVCNRLPVISHEDINSIAAPWAVPYVDTACRQAADAYAKKPENPGKTRMFVGNAIRIMCAAPKSRVADHFQAGIGWSNLFGDVTPVIPDWAKDKHTAEGRRMGRGLDHFREVGAHLVEKDGTVVPEDGYADQAYAAWQAFEGAKSLTTNTQEELGL